MAVNGVYIVQGELNAVVALLRRGQKWQPLSDEQDPLLRSFADLREVINSVADLADMSPSTFLTPFLEVIRSEQTSGLVTGQALAAVGKFLSYGLVDCDSMAAPSAVQRIADAVTHARFVGTDAGSDEVVLLRILQVLRALLLTPVGALLTDEAVCEVLQSCFRICFERRLSELLRKAAESCLADMVQLLFTRLPTFVEDPRHPYIRRLKMRAGFKDGSGGGAYSSGGGSSKRKSKKRNETDTNTVGESPNTATTDVTRIVQEIINVQDGNVIRTEIVAQESVDSVAATTRDRRESKVVDVHENLGFVSDEDNGALSAPMSRTESSAVLSGNGIVSPVELNSINSEQLASAIDEITIPPGEQQVQQRIDSVNQVPADQISELPSNSSDPSLQSIINERGVTFTTASAGNEDGSPVAMATGGEEDLSVGSGVLQGPYGLPCIRELLRFLISISNPAESQNTDNMMELGLNLLIVALEAGADHLGQYGLLLPLIQNEMCKNATCMLLTPKLTLFASTLRLGFLCFEALRTHLKFQLESYLTRLMELVLSDIGNAQGTISGSGSSSNARGGAMGASAAILERKELALEALVQLWRIPGLVTELYLNYDCDLYCSNLFEELTKLLSKNAFPVAGLLSSTHVLSLDALLTVVDTIETNCHYRMLNYKEKTGVSEDATSISSSTTADERGIGGKVQSPSHMLPVASGFSAGKVLSKTILSDTAIPPHSNAEVVEVLRLPQLRPNRMPISPNIPSHEDLIAQKQKKRLLATGTELFNQSPSKGIAFLQEHGLLRAPLILKDVVVWLKENPRLDKRKIAEYIVNRKNTKILEAFVQSFDFANIRLDEALRLFLETFRLPGEAAEISMVIEHFSDHWHRSNGNPFASVDAAFTLAYAVIMLNVDQHNTVAKRQQQPMTVEAFKKNLNGVNGGKNFDPQILEEIYKAINSEEIIMPAEQTGLVKENYLWKMLLKRGAGQEGRFIHAPSGLYDHDLFVLVWGPTVAALSYVFDKSADESVVGKTVGGYRKCAAVAAHYGMSDVFDNLVINLCKFSTLLSGSSMEYPEQLGVEFGENSKAQLAAKAMFQLVHSHGDILREGWKNLSDCLLQLFRAQLLPDYLTQVEDFSSPKGWITIVRPSKTKKSRNEAGLFSSLYNYLGGGTTTEGRELSEDQKFIKISKDVIAECRPEQLVYDSKYLTSDALSELLKALVVASAALTADSRGVCGGLGEQVESSTVFYLESMVSVCIENRDRLVPYWRTIRTHIYSLLSDFPENSFLIERAVVCLLRLAARLLIREEITDEVLASLAMLLSLKKSSLVVLARQIAVGLHELLRSNAANIHQKEHWSIIFTLLEAVGAAAFPVELDSVPPKHQHHLGAASGRPSTGTNKSKPVETLSDTDDAASHGEDGGGSDRGYTSDSELYGGVQSKDIQPKRAGSSLNTDSRTGSGEWLYVDHRGALSTKPEPTSAPNSTDLTSCAGILILRQRLRRHDPCAFVKCCETLAFLVRDAAHVTPENFESCVCCLRTFVEASLNGGNHDSAHLLNKTDASDPSSKKQRRAAASAKSAKHAGDQSQKSKTPTDASSTSAPGEETDPIKQLPNTYLQVSLQLLDLVHTLHIKAAAIHRSWAQSGESTVDASASAVWNNCWRPLLQALARLCCDQRKQVRTAAQTYLQRALLVHDLQALTAAEWEDCCVQVLFPFLSALLDANLKTEDAFGLDEARVRATTLTSKVFLQHLGPLSTVPKFWLLWSTILDYMERYLHLDSGDLNESIPESVKNMLLVMETAGLFRNDPVLAQATKEKLAAFLPDLAETLKTAESQQHQTPAGAVNPTAGATVGPNVNPTAAAAVGHNVINPTAGAPILTEPVKLQHQDRQDSPVRSFPQQQVGENQPMTTPSPPPANPNASLMMEPEASLEEIIIM